ncbi:hypothetical protein JCM3774_004333 [Rhodotorula dairenensis]
MSFSSSSTRAPAEPLVAHPVSAVSLSALLVEHDNDPARALASLVSRYNRLVSQHAALRQERDSAVQDATRSAQENELLWRSFKANSPRPLVPRSNSDQHGAVVGSAAVAGGAGSGTTTRGLGIGPAASSPTAGHAQSRLETPNLRPTRRMPSNDSGLFAVRNESLSSTSSPREPAAAPLPTDASSAQWLDYPPASGPNSDRSPRPIPQPQYYGGSAGHNFSPSALHRKSATPPPNSSARPPSEAGPSATSLLRKASSLDLGRRTGAAGAAAIPPPPKGAIPSKHTGASSPSYESDTFRFADSAYSPPLPPTGTAGPPPQTPPPPGSNPPTLRRVMPSPRISGSASMPMLADPGLNERRFLPTLSPVSPFSFGGTSDVVGSGSNPSPRDTTATSTGLPSLNSLRSGAAAGEQLQAQLQLPRRDRTVSSNSSLGGLFDERALGAGGSGNGLSSPPPPARSASINVLSPNASPYRVQQQAVEGAGSAATHQFHRSTSGSLRERRPSVPNKLQYPPATTQPTAAGLGESASDGASIGGAASAPVSRRPSDGGGAGTVTYPRGGLGSLPSPTLPPPPISPRTPLPPDRDPARQPVLTPALLPHAQPRVVSSSLRMNDRHKETVWFQIAISLASAPPPELEAAAAAFVAPSSPASPFLSDPPRPVPTSWRIEKSWTELQALDAQVRSKANRQEGKSLASLPDKSLFKDHAPQRSDQRKGTVERYLQTLTTISLRDKSAVCAFLTSDIVTEGSSVASTSNSAKEGWLTKKGRAFGGWQTRYYILTSGASLAYYDTPGGSKVGEIPLQTAQIGRQSSRAADSGDDAYAHALLIRTQTGKDEADHILCADNDDERDAWIQALTTLGPSRTRSGNVTTSASSVASGHSAFVERERVFSTPSLPTAPPIPTISHEPESPRVQERRRSGSGPASMSVDSHSMMMQQQQPPQDTRGLSARSAGDQLPPSVSLPSNLDALARGMPAMDGLSTKKVSPILEEETLQPPLHASEASNVRSSRMVATGPATSGGTVPPAAAWRSLAAPDRPQSPDKRVFEHAAKYTASDVSSPMNAVPLPSGFEFKKIERQKKTKSSFWNFASRGGSSDKANASAPARPVFGVPLKEAVAVSRIRPGLELPAIVYRCVEFLEAKNAENEEGIFRLSGSTNVIRQLKERFDAEGDVNLLQSTEFYDLHAVAGLLKQYLRDLPPPLLTRPLQPEFLRVIDLRRREDQVNALGKLVQQLPIEEYTLFRFFFAHLCTIAQNAETSKMNLRNLGIVFSPTLAIPAPLFTLFLSEFDLVFAVDRETGAAKPTMLLGGLGGGASEAASSSPSSSLSSAADKRAAHRNSQIYEASGANKLMESELLRLRENDEDEPADSPRTESDHPTFDRHDGGRHLADGSASAPRTPSPAVGLAPNSPSVYGGAGPTTPSSSLASGGGTGSAPSPRLYAPSPPRSAQLPSSPRPGVSFQSH